MPRRHLVPFGAPLSLILLATSSFAVSAASDDVPQPPGDAPVPHYVEEAGTGVDHRYEGSWQFFTGGGVAVLDCDDDELPDLYLAGGTEPAGLYRNTSDLGGPLSFEQVESAATDLTEVTGAYPLDIDSDGRTDLAVLRRGENVLLRGLGGCTFERANEAWGFDGGDDWSTAFSATWQAGDTRPTLAVGDYLTIVEGGQTPECDDNALFRPASDSYGPPETMTGHCSLSMLFSDWSRNGQRDLRVANDRQYYRPGVGEEQLWQVGPSAPAEPYARDDGWQHQSLFGMGIASQDVTADGYPEYFISTKAGNQLQTLADHSGRPTFTDMADRAGVDAAQPFAGDITLPSTAWHAEWDDVNNDGRFDLYVAKGNVEMMPDHAAEDPSNLLIGQPDGTWSEGAIEAGIVHFDKTRGAALVDLNLDGLLDLLEVNRAAPVRIWRNAGAGTATDPAPMGHWLAVELSQDGPNPDAVGAWIEVQTDAGVLEREVTVGGGHVSGQSGPTHFGLGGTDRPALRVTWPDGEVGEWITVPGDQRIRIERDRDEAVALVSATELTGALGLAHESADGEMLSPVPPVDPATCVRTTDPSKSVARLWDEALLDAIRRDFPAPTVHARNLYHVSAAMWDAWAAYDPAADGVYFTDKAQAADVAAAREAAISYAAYGLLSHRYRHAVGGPQSLRQFDQLMADLCYPWMISETEGDSPEVLGSRIAAHIIEATMDDGSREASGYLTTDYVAANEPMIVQEPGTVMAEPNRWQPLALAISYTQNGQLLPVGPQQFIGPHWGDVAAFALPEPAAPGLPIDPGEPPLLHDETSQPEFKAKAIEVVRYSSLLDPRDGVVVDISPAVFGNAPLGTNDWSGHAYNPYTGLPYEPVLVPRADYGRVLAEFWADGPDSETPPGHWNSIANAVTDHPDFQRRIGGRGSPVDPLE
ncbi:MAG: CRTAC1 family protein, partial [Chloroflexota bacterium]